MSRKIGQVRGLLIWAMISPFLLLSLISPAVMPQRGADGVLTVMLCSVEGPVALTIDPVSGVPVKKAPAAGERCAWAGAHAELIAVASPSLRMAAPVVRAAEAAPSVLILSHARATGLPPATGPPADV